MNLYKLFDPAIKLLNWKTKQRNKSFAVASRCNNDQQQKNVEKPHDDAENNETPSPLIRASATIKILMQSRACVPVHAMLHGMVIIQSEPNLFDKHDLICTNRVAHVEPNKMFWLLLANFANQLRQIFKDQVVTSALINPICFV